MSNESRAVLVTESCGRRCGDRLHEVLAGRGRVQLLPEGATLSAQQLADVQAAFLSPDLMKASNKQAPNPALAAFGAAVNSAPSLRWLHTAASGTDRPLLQDAMRRGVAVTSSPGANAASVAQTAIAGVLALARGVPGWVRDQDARRWSAPTLPRDLDGQHAVVIGLGAIGSRVARGLRALGLRVTGVRRQAGPHADCDAVAAQEQLPALLPQADWLLLCCPLNAQTRDLVDAALLARLPAHAGLVNVARGEVVVEADLFDAVRAGRLGAVYADVFVEEPLPAESPWWDLPRTLISPHVAAMSKGFVGRTEEMFLANLQRWLDGAELHNLARPG
ncbi:D-2-hydroxyacid dehydrogenase [Ramlibacter sp. G-1-2-2]|uniref:D-2-hydroxyacid dehydrogenase n=1 Tax=Ramlibacter agri TaxID=2728837 RepID=A0A848H6B0_9BURK|nr:D-2-hydroxyacid dehydrogenase [Ramlibacter agri]NML44830.1 D-2-hydroxyacid dehydrogenase [Ramlibacter agri]